LAKYTCSLTGQVLSLFISTDCVASSLSAWKSTQAEESETGALTGVAVSKWTLRTDGFTSVLRFLLQREDQNIWAPFRFIGLCVLAVLIYTVAVLTFHR
jgi:hypothetical protein